jgi:hypothetical protein
MKRTGLELPSPMLGRPGPIPPGDDVPRRPIRGALALSGARIVAIGAAVPDATVPAMDQQLRLVVPRDGAGSLRRLRLNLVCRAGLTRSLDLYAPALVTRGMTCTSPCFGTEASFMSF